MFIRKKKIKGKSYAYLAKSTWVDSTSKQEVVKYLGRIYFGDEQPPLDTASVPTKDLLHQLILYESQELADVNITDKTVQKGSQDVVIAVNGGYICDYTLNTIFSSLHVTDEKRPGLQLAKAFSQAGIRVDKDDFITLYMHYQNDTNT